MKREPKSPYALPLSASGRKVAVFGQNSVDFVYGGAGSGAIDTKTAPTLKTALESSDHGGFTVDAALWNFYENGGGKSYRKSYHRSADYQPYGQYAIPRSRSKERRTCKSIRTYTIICSD